MAVRLRFGSGAHRAASASCAILRVLGFVLLCSFVFAQQTPQYTIQVAANLASESKKTDEILAKLKDEKWAPIHKFTEGDRLKVCVGSFETNVEAQWWKSELRKKDFPDAFVKTVVLDKKEPMSGPSNRMFKTARSESPTATKVESQVRAKLPAGKQKLFRQVGGATPAEVEELIAAWRPVADGELPASRAEIAKARKAIAHAMHYGPNRRLLDAYKAYDEAMEMTAEASPERDQCIVERAAIIMELARSGKGTLAEFRSTAEKAALQVTTGNENAQAVLALMHAESWFHEKHYEQALSEFLNIPKRWPTQRRESLAAQVFAGGCYVEMNRLPEARLALATVLKEDVKADEQFAVHGVPRDFKKDAAAWLAKICAKQGDFMGSSVWRDFSNGKTAALGQGLPLDPMEGVR